MRTCPVWSLHVVIKFVNANAVYLSVSVFPCAIAHCVHIPMLNMFISDRLSPPLGLCLLAQSLWRESNVLDNWQLTTLPCSELCEFNPHWVRDNLSASLCVCVCVVIYKNMFVCLYGSKSALPTCLLTCLCCFDVICVIGGRAMSVNMYGICVRKIKQ